MSPKSLSSRSGVWRTPLRALSRPHRSPRRFKDGSNTGTKYAGSRDLGSLADYVRTHTGSKEEL